MNAPENAGVQPPVLYNSVTVAFTSPTGGGEPTYYQLRVHNDTNPLIPDFAVNVLPEQRSITFAATPSTTYTLRLCAENEVTEACVTPLNSPVTTPPAPITVPPPAVGPFAPFYTADAFIRQNYVDWLGRAPRFDELNFYREALSHPGYTPNEFLEHLRAEEPEQDPSAAGVVRLYKAYFLRNPDYTGFNHYRKVRAQGTRSLFRISAQFAGSSEFQRTYGTLDDGEFVSLVYRNVLGRNPDSSGYAYYTRQIQKGVSRGAVMLSFSESNEYQRINKVSVATSEVFAAMLGRMPTLNEYDLFTRDATIMADGGTELNQPSMDIIFDNVQRSDLGHYGDHTIDYQARRNGTVPGQHQPIVLNCGPLIQPVACYGPGGITPAEQLAYDNPVSLP